MAKAVGPYTPVVRAGDWLIVSGQIGVRDGSLVTGGMRDELRQALANLRALLEGEGASLDEVVKTTVFLTRAEDFAPLNAVYARRFGAHRPARSTVIVAALPAGAALEIDLIARVAGN